MSKTLSKEQLIEAGIQHLASGGVAALRVEDGHVIQFSKEALESLLSAADKNGSAIVFIKHGPSATDPEVNN